MPGDDRDRDEPSMIKLSVPLSVYLPPLRCEMLLGFGIVLPVFCPRCQSASASYTTWDEFDISIGILQWAHVQHDKLRVNFLSTC